MEKSLEELKAEALRGQWLGGRKLTFSEKCGAFAALYAGVSNKVVAYAFGLAAQTVSKLSGCLEYDPEPYKREVMEVADEKHRVEVVENKIMRDHNERRNPARHRHYNDVAREFEALGAEEFDRRYYTERVVKRIIIAKVQLRDGDKRWRNNRR